MESLGAAPARERGEVESNRSDNECLNDIADRRYSRRQTLLGGASATGVAVFSSALVAGLGSSRVDAKSTAAPDGHRAPTVTSGQMVSLPVTSGAQDDVSVKQFAGPPVEVLSEGDGSPSFIAPAVHEATTIGLNIREKKDGRASDVRHITITVLPATMTFPAIAKNKHDRVTVPDGYSVTVVTALGDSILGKVPQFKNDGTDRDFARRIGDHGDALIFFGLGADGRRDDQSSTRGLLAQNHEDISQTYLHPNGPSPVPRPRSEAIKEIEAHGVSITELIDHGGREWSVVRNGPFNRRITPNTPMDLHGPASAAASMRTKYSPDGTKALGTINNCSNGLTGWGSLLTCEENWAECFSRSGDDANRTAKELVALERYAVTQAVGDYAWASVTTGEDIFRRWDANATEGQPIDDFRNEPNHFGWVVEIDPYDPKATPRKRTALGRMGHEGAWLGKLAKGRKIAVYMGDDARNEYFYKFVSSTHWDPKDAQSENRLALGDKYLDSGTLYVARFNDDGTGQWLPLVHGQVPDLPDFAFANQADILIHARLAADAQGATPMDRPEWTACNPATGEIYLTLTNNKASKRPIEKVNTANPRFYNDPPNTKPKEQGNPNGHIIRIHEHGDDPASNSFQWDIFLFGADSADAKVDGVDRNISGLTAENDFSSPDGLRFSRATNPAGKFRPLLWIQTDDSAMQDRTNNQMLAALPGHVGDGRAMTAKGSDISGSRSSQPTQVGREADIATLRRFLVGPKECEITGVDTTPDGRTLFVGIQHPGEDGSWDNPTSHWPQSQTSGNSGRPRSGVVAITRDDGGVVGL